jgi:hypothetical protein
MIIIDSSETLLSTALGNRLQAAHPGESFIITRNHGSEPLPLGRQRTASVPIEHAYISCFIINEYPINVYELYTQTKTIIKRLSQFAPQEILIHVVVKLSMNDIIMLSQIQSQCSHLGHLVMQSSSNVIYRLNIQFSCVYNVYGMIHSSIIQTGSNDVQTLLYLLKNPAKHFSVPFGEQEPIIGTDVEDAVSLILERTGEVKDPLGLHVIPVNTPEIAKSLIEILMNHFPERYPSIGFGEDRKSFQNKVSPLGHSQTYYGSLSAQFIKYLD